MPPINLDVLKLDYTTSRSMIDKFDNYILQTMNWAVASCGGVLFVGLSKASVVLTSSAILVAPFFNLFSYIFKCFQLDIVQHSIALEQILNSCKSSPEDVDFSYEFGVGRVLQPLTLGRLWQVATEPTLSYQHLFFLMICVLVLLADLYLLL